MNGPEWYEIAAFIVVWLPIIWVYQSKKDAALHEWIMKRVTEIFEQETHCHLPK